MANQYLKVLKARERRWRFEVAKYTILAKLRPTPFNQKRLVGAKFYLSQTRQKILFQKMLDT